MRTPPQVYRNAEAAHVKGFYAQARLRARTRTGAHSIELERGIRAGTSMFRASSQGVFRAHWARGPFSPPLVHCDASMPVEPTQPLEEALPDAAAAGMFMFENCSGEEARAAATKAIPTAAAAGMFVSCAGSEATAIVASEIKQPTKKPRVEAPPAFIDEASQVLAAEAGTQPSPTPRAQADVGGTSSDKKAKWSLEAPPIIDPQRQMPANFEQSAMAAYLRVPSLALPRAASKGRFNYTLKDKSGATMEVQLANKIFRVLKLKGGKPNEGVKTFPWYAYESLDEAFEAACKHAEFDFEGMPAP